MPQTLDVGLWTDYENHNGNRRVFGCRYGYYSQQGRVCETRSRRRAGRVQAGTSTNHGYDLNCFIAASGKLALRGNRCQLVFDGALFSRFQ